MFKENLNYEYFKRELRVGDSFVRLSIQEYNNETASIVEKSVQKIHGHFDSINTKVRLLDEIKDSVDINF